jgi:uncharacterized protein
VAAESESGDRPIRRREREITDPAALEAVLHDAKVLQLALVDNGRPYVVPMYFGYADGKLYLHSAGQGRKIDLLAESPNVAFTVIAEQEVVAAEKACGFSARYRCVMGEGQARFVTDPAGKARALDTLMRKFTAGPLAYADKVLAQTAIIEIAITSMTGKQAGA